MRKLALWKVINENIREIKACEESIRWRMAEKQNKHQKRKIPLRKLKRSLKASCTVALSLSEGRKLSAIKYIRRENRELAQ